MKRFRKRVLAWLFLQFVRALPIPLRLGHASHLCISVNSQQCLATERGIL
jgi:hypothetical protein